jgi:hypothetical protein
LRAPQILYVASAFRRKRRVSGLATRDSRLATGNRQPETANWQLATGNWQLKPDMQTFKNHAHRPTATIVGYMFLVVALVAFRMRWSGGGRVTFAVGLLALCGSIATLLAISRWYTTALQDRIIKLEMRVRTATMLSAEQQRLLGQLSNKQIAALRFASDAELPALLERAAREKLPPTEIKRAITTWTPDLDRT